MKIDFILRLCSWEMLWCGSQNVFSSVLEQFSSSGCNAVAEATQKLQRSFHSWWGSSVCTAVLFVWAYKTQVPNQGRGFWNKVGSRRADSVVSTSSFLILCSQWSFQGRAMFHLCLIPEDHSVGYRMVPWRSFSSLTSAAVFRKTCSFYQPICW